MCPLSKSCDVLVLGAGLAGLRAALSAARAGADVLLATASPAPSGSSFANPNGQLGMQVPLTDTERAEYVREAMVLAGPGGTDESLLRILADESCDRFEELLELGAEVRLAPDGSRHRQRGCFSPHDRAAVLTDLPGLFTGMRDAARGAGCRFLTGAEVLGLIGDSEQVHGAWIHRHKEGPGFLRAKAVVMALGGPAPLFARHTAGPGNPGWGWALLDAAGARRANTFLQCMWLSVEGRTFCSPADLAGPGARLKTPDGKELSPPGKITALAESRATHCPASYSLEDAAMDRWLVSMADKNGVIRCRPTDGTWQEAALFAHAGNGGAVIDEWGATNIAGLNAAGECATGMHGADRIGGGMVAATQVFGHRAGQGAARFAQDTVLLSQKAFDECCLPLLSTPLHHPDDAAMLAEAQALLTPEAAYTGENSEEIRTGLARMSRSACGWRTLLDIRSRLLLMH